MKNLPTYNEQRLKGDQGLSLVKYKISTDLNWIFRENNLENDFGIDGYIDIIGDHNSVTGKSIAVQVKTGDSFFKHKTLSGWTHFGDDKHLNYYLNLDIPIVVFIVNLIEKEIYWELITIDKITKTNKGWKLLIPNRNKVNISTKKDFTEIAGQLIDYMPQIDYQLKLQNKLNNSSLIVLNISKNEIENVDTLGIQSLLKKLVVDDDTIKKSESKLTFMVDGYNNDSREIYEIAEVRVWFKKVFSEFKYWGYFLNMDPNISNYTGLKYLNLCICDYTIESKDSKTVYVSPDLKQTVEVLEQLFEWLNEFTDLYSIPLITNEKKSNEMSRALLGSLLDK